ncbi:MAG: methylated-DNA--[protein]-cysteine S-methyltransferase [Candidatus Binatia bacterium]
MVERARMVGEGRRAAQSDGVAAEGIQIFVRPLRTPVGVLQVAASARRVLYIELTRRRSEQPFERWLRGRVLRRAETPALHAALTQLREYFAGRRRAFDVPLDPAGTPFQQRVWQMIAAIPYGQTVSYGEIARDLGNRQVTRAVGAAVGANPIPIIIPCHRVIGADGSLTGYGGGLRMKAWLLRHEGVLLA